MAFATKADLVTAVLAWLNREGDTALAAVVPDWIKLAEARLRREQDWFRQTYSVTNGTPLQITAYPQVLPAFVREVTTLWNANAMSHGEIEILTPSAWRGFVQMNSALGVTPMKAIVTPQMDRFLQATAAGAAQGAYLYIWPQPPTDGSLYVDFEYIRDLDPLTDSAVNGLYLRHPDAYLYGTLVQSAPYLQHDDRIQVWEGMYQQAVKEINIERERAQFAASRKRPTLPRKF